MIWDKRLRVCKELAALQWKPEQPVGTVQRKMFATGAAQKEELKTPTACAAGGQWGFDSLLKAVGIFSCSCWIFATKRIRGQRQVREQQRGGAGRCTGRGAHLEKGSPGSVLPAGAYIFLISV